MGVGGSLILHMIKVITNVPMIMKDTPLVHRGQQLQTESCQKREQVRAVKIRHRTPFVDSMPDQPHELNTSYSNQMQTSMK